MAQIQLSNVSKRWGAFVGVQSFELTIPDREFLVPLRLPGCGKTTTIRMIAGLQDVSEGEIVIYGKVVNNPGPKDREVAMVFKSYVLYPNLDVYENIRFPLQMRKVDSATHKDRVMRAAEVVGLTEFLHRCPAALSPIDAAFILPICIWVLKNAFDSISVEIYEAALVDGCSPITAMIRTLLPLSAPGLVAVSVVAFSYVWNEYLFAVTLISSPEIRPVSVGLASLKVMLDTPVDRVLAAVLFFSIFPVTFYLLIQRYIVAGLNAELVKG
jgi:hypothetical protein